jgi:hypothetical protein
MINSYICNITIKIEGMNTIKIGSVIKKVIITVVIKPTKFMNIPPKLTTFKLPTP